MTSNERMALLFKMIESLRKAKNWTGETSIHKALYILKKLMGVEITYDFTLYLHGPFSFDLRDDLCKLVAYDLIKLEYQSANYGPKHDLTQASYGYLAKHKTFIDQYDEKISKVCGLINTKSVVSLEKLATALYVIKELDKTDKKAAAMTLTKLKPHITETEANMAVEEVMNWIKNVEDSA